MVLLASFILLAMLVGLTLREREKPTWPEAILIDAFGWVQGAVMAPVQHVAGFFEEVQHIKELYNENARLKANLNDFSSMRVQIQELERQNKQLKEDLGLVNRSTDLKLLAANVVGRSPSTWNSTITLDVGAKAGVTKDMAVITANRGLVGRVYEVTPYHSKVLLITDMEKMYVSAMVQTTNSKTTPYGFVRGADDLLPQSQRARVEMTNIPLSAVVKKGDAVVTSGLSDIFPPSLLIGQVTKVEQDKLGLTQTAEIEPFANLDHLEIVYVVTNSKQAAKE
jgi:rod shape-determining protein MreC